MNTSLLDTRMPVRLLAVAAARAAALVAMLSMPPNVAHALTPPPGGEYRSPDDTALMISLASLSTASAALNIYALGHESTGKKAIGVAGSSIGMATVLITSLPMSVERGRPGTAFRPLALITGAVALILGSATLRQTTSPAGTRVIAGIAPSMSGGSTVAVHVWF